MLNKIGITKIVLIIVLVILFLGLGLTKVYEVHLGNNPGCQKSSERNIVTT